MTRWILTTVLIGGTLTACGGGPGTVGGYLPICYGPGPDLNLTPTRVVTVRQNGKVVTTQTFPSDRDHQHYELQLEAGTYEISIPGLPPIQAKVRAGKATTADLPVQSCA